MKRKRKLRRKSFKFTSKKIVFIFFIALFFLVIFLIVKSQFFNLTSLEVQIEKTNCTDKDKIKDSADLLGQNIFFINRSKVENELKKKYLCIKSVAISKIFPNKIKLEVSEREPAMIASVLKDKEATQSAIFEKFTESIATDSAEVVQSEKFVVDNEGVVYSTNIEQINAPNVYMSGFNISLGQKMKEHITFNTLKILERVKSFGVEIKEAKIYSEKILLVSGEPKIIFRLDNGIDEQIASLQLILGEAKMNRGIIPPFDGRDSNSLEFIDLRFDKPIVKFAPKKK